MSTKKDGGPAFPTEYTQPGDSAGSVTRRIVCKGLSIRDYFAGQAMQAIIAKIPTVDSKGEHGIQLDAEAKAQWMRDVALSAYDYADHMLKAREQ